jgi:hypothetical protein
MIHHLIEALLLGLLCGALAAALNRAQHTGMLLAGYGRVLDRWMLGDHRVLRFLAKPLGGCLFCTAWWVAVSYSGLLNLHASVWPLSAAVACLAATYLNSWLTNERSNSM